MLSYSDFYNPMLLSIRYYDTRTSPETLASLCALAAQSVLCAADASSDKQETALATEARESLDILDKAEVATVPAGATLSERVRCLLGNYHHHRNNSERLLRHLTEVSQERDRAIAARNHLESTMTKDAKRHDAKVAEMQDELDGTKRSGDHYFGIVQKFGKTIAEQKKRIQELEAGAPTKGQIDRTACLESAVNYWEAVAKNWHARVRPLEEENARLRAALQATRDAADTALAMRAADPLT